jgi:acyl carrier protein
MAASPLSPQGRQKMLAVLLVALLVFSVGVIIRAYRVVREVSGFSTYDRVRAVLVRRMSVEKPRVSPSASLSELADDLDRREFVHALNEEFELDLAEDKAQSFATVQDVVNFVDRQLTARRSR